MNISIKTSFIKDAKKCPSELRIEIEKTIVEIENAKSLKEIADLKKLKGHNSAYRIKIKTYRFCFYFENGVVEIARFLPRKDVYRFFP